MLTPNKNCINFESVNHILNLNLLLANALLTSAAGGF